MPNYGSLLIWAHWNVWVSCDDLLALVYCVLGFVSAVVEATLEQLDSDDGEDELEQHVDDHDVEDVLERIHHTVEHRLHATSITHKYNMKHLYIHAHKTVEKPHSRSTEKKLSP